MLEKIRFLPGYTEMREKKTSLVRGDRNFFGRRYGRMKYYGKGDGHSAIALCTTASQRVAMVTISCSY